MKIFVICDLEGTAGCVDMRRQCGFDAEYYHQARRLATLELNALVKGVLEAIREILPVSFETMELAVKVPVEHAGKVSSVMHNMAPVKKEEWKSDAWYAVIEIPAGRQNEIYEKINNLTSGNAEVKVISRNNL